MSAGVRAELDERAESVGRKIRDAELRKIPFMLVVGDREQANGEVSVREHRAGDSGSASLDAFALALMSWCKSAPAVESAAILAPVDPTAHHTARLRLSSRRDLS